jgi:rSAM/selenodomain-associated transferase 2
MSAPLISVVIPALDEGGGLRRLLDDLGREPTPHETIVVDGGSRDGTVTAARAAGARVLAGTPGRGAQLALGARQAAGDVLLFLHADCRFSAGGLAHVRAALDSDAANVGGNFRLLFDGATRFDRWLEGFYAWIRARGFYYGDSGIFVRRAVYQAIGGIRPIALMEDYDFVRRLERAGATCCIDDPPLVTSSRRFAGRFPPAIVFGWFKIHALYHIGVSPDRLARMYYGR